MEAMKRDKKYTLEDWLVWPEDERWELIDGVAHMMATPTIQHQDISDEIGLQLRLFLKGKSCKSYSAIGVNLNSKEDTVFVPDISVVCDHRKLADGKICVGAPDMVVEILSQSTAGRDRLKKFNKYLEAGVREYWIVDPEAKVVNVNILENGKYVNHAYGITDTVPVHVLDGCTINLQDVFAGAQST